MSTPKETPKKKYPLAPIIAATLALATAASALAQEAGYKTKAEGKYGYQKTMAPAEETDPNYVPDGTEGFSDVQRSHFKAHKAEGNEWFEPAADDVALLDGTEKSFSYNQLALIYTNVNPAIQIDLILKNLPKKYSKEARDYLVKKAKGIVAARSAVTGEHHCPETETLMCFVINRGIEIADIIDSLSNHQQPGILDQEVRVLASALVMAREEYKPMMDFALNKSHKPADIYYPNYQKFGKEFADKFMVINEGVLSARAQYAVAFTVLGYFQYDLIRKRTKGEGNANYEASKAAAAVLYEAMAAPGMITPDQDPDLIKPFQRLKNIRALWEAFFDAKDVLNKYAPAIEGKNGPAA